jgi:hypothetical protein
MSYFYRNDRGRTAIPEPEPIESTVFDCDEWDAHDSESGKLVVHIQ